MSENIELAKMQARKLKNMVENSDTNISSDDGYEVMDAIEKTLEADTKEDIPKEIGGVLFFKSNTIAKNHNIQNFPSEFRKIHVLLGRDIDMEKRHIKQEKECDLNSYELRELDKQSR